MELILKTVTLESIADLLERKPQKLRFQLNKFGIPINDDDSLTLEDAQIGLLELGVDWEELVPVIEIEEARDLESEESILPPEIYTNLADFELDLVHETLTSPTDPYAIRQAAQFLERNAEFDLAARIWASAIKNIRTDYNDESVSLQDECKLNYARCRSSALQLAGKYRHASELAFAGIEYSRELGRLEKNDEFVRLYLSSILLEEGVLTKQEVQGYSVEELLMTGLKSENVQTVDELHLAIMRALYIFESFIERLKLSRQTRVALGKSLDHMKDEISLDPRYQGEDLYNQLARAVTEPISEIIRGAESFLSSYGYIGIIQNRSQLIIRLKKLGRFLKAEEQEAANAMLMLLREPLTRLGKQREEGSIREYGTAYYNLVAMIKNLMHQIDAKPSWLSSGVILPIAKWLGDCLNADFVDRTSAYTTSIEIDLQKKEYPLQIGEPQETHIVCRNQGNYLAEEVKVVLESTSDIEVTPAFIEFGDINTGSTYADLSLNVTILAESAVYEIPFRITWLEVTGQKTRKSSVLKLLPQKKIDWNQYRYRNPYSISSIKSNEPERLKGRADKLIALRMGLENMQSFFISGQKRVGKSSIANVYLGELIKHENILPIHFYWGDVADCDLPKLGEAICTMTRDGWMDRTNSKLPFTVPHLDDFRSSFSLTLSNFLRQFNRQYPTWKLVYIIDDFDEIREDLYKGETGDAFFTTLRAFIDRDFCSFIIIGSESLNTTILREQGSKINQADTLQVDYLVNRNDLAELIAEPSKDILYFNQEAISQIIELTAGNPYFANLLCSRLFRLMIQEQDYYCTGREIRAAADLLAKEDTEKSYNHFWTDGIRDTGPEKEKIAYDNAMALIAVSMSQPDLAEDFVDIRMIFEQPEVKHLETAELEYRLNELADRNVLQRSPKSPTKYRNKIPIFKKWLQVGGAHQIRQSFGQYEFVNRPLAEYALFPEEIRQLAEDLVYRGLTIDNILVETWLRQFGDDYNQRLAYKVLCALKERGFYSTDRFNNALERMFKQAAAMALGWAEVVTGTTRKLRRNVLVCYIDPVGKSGPAIVTEFRRVNQIFHKNCGNINEMARILQSKAEALSEMKHSEKWLLIIVDDFVGSGNSGADYIIQALETLDEKCPGWSDLCHPYYSFVSGFKAGAQLIEDASEGRVSTLIVDPIEEKHRAFSPRAKLFDEERERIIAKKLFKKIGIALEKKNPLGYEDSEALVVFPNNVPNNTLPAFFKRGRYDDRIWLPLFERV